MNLERNEWINLLDSIDFKSIDIESVVSCYKLTFKRHHRVERMEYGIKIPNMVNQFHNYLKDNQFVPSQEEFGDYYFESENEAIESLNLTPDEKNALLYRVFRAYPSFVRDIHFALYLKDRGHRVLVNTELDMLHNIDVLLTDGNSTHYGINLYTLTKNSFIALKRKKERSKLFSNVNYVKLPIDLNKGKKFGQFVLYHKDEYKLLIQNIKEY